MMNIKILLILPYILVITYARGPHHPRGEKIVKRHVHYKPTKDTTEKLTDDVELLHDKEHIQEHLEDVIPEPDLSKLSDEELEFYYFQVHDTDKNSKLDGLEILQAISHISHEDAEHGKDVFEDPTDAFNYYVELIDQVLREDDSDQDGYLSYSEYVAGRRQSKNRQNYTNTPEVKMLP